MKEIKLAHGYTAIVDDDDFERIAHNAWHIRKRKRSDGSVASVYAIRNALSADGRRTSREMHRDVMCAKYGQQVDHINGNGLDNRKENLRFCTSQENARNRRPALRGSTPKGVSWHKRTKKWQAQIKIAGKTIYLGVYNSEHDASAAYIKAAKRHFLDFAWQDPLAGVGPSPIDECPFL